MLGITEDIAVGVMLDIAMDILAGEVPMLPRTAACGAASTILKS